ncbi:hypothetical protein CYMTET_52960, partial [Cymbomonas tetramitiformis]
TLFKSKTLWVDGMAGIIGSIEGILISICTLIYMVDAEVWWIDDVLSLVMALFLSIFAVYTLNTLAAHEWWKIAFWIDP